MRKVFNEIFNGFGDMFSIMLEEYKRIFTDFGVLLLFVGAILFYPLIYSFVYGGEMVKNVPIAIIDESGSNLSRQFVEMIDATEQLTVELQSTNMLEVKPHFYSGDVHGIIVIPSDFSKNIKKGKQTQVNVLCDASSFMFYKQMMEGANVVGATLGAGIQIKKLMSSEGITADQALKKADPIEFVSIALFDPVGGYASYLMPALLLMILQQILLMGIGLLGGTIAEKKAYHYLLPFAKKRRGSIRVTLGKGLAYYFIFLVAAFYLLVCIYKWFSFPHRTELYNILLFVIPYILSVTFMGLFLSTFFKNRENALIFLLFTSIPFLFLSGFSWPEQEWYAIFKWLADVVPSTWAIRGFMKLNQMGASLKDVSQEWFALWAMAGIFFIAATLRFKRIIFRAKG